MFDSHLATWQAETAVPASERAWLAWIGRVEALLGHSADGDQRTDGYSMDGFYALWKRGDMSPEQAVFETRCNAINVYPVQEETGEIMDTYYGPYTPIADPYGDATCNCSNPYCQV